MPDVFPWLALGRYLISIFSGSLTAWALYEHFLTGSEEFDVIYWRRAQLQFVRVGNDNLVTTLDVVKHTGDGPSFLWEDDDYEFVEAAIVAFWSDVRELASDQTAYDGVRWYQMAFDPDWPGSSGDQSKFLPSILPERIIVGLGQQGTGNSYYLPPQCRCVITEKTALPRHWGRMFVPCDGTDNALSNGGQLDSSDVSNVLAAYALLWQTLFDEGYSIVVPVGQVDKIRVAALLTIAEASVDSIVDIQRSGRPDVAENSGTLTMGA